jgi:hypothetical protein
VEDRPWFSAIAHRSWPSLVNLTSWVRTPFRENGDWGKAANEPSHERTTGRSRVYPDDVLVARGRREFAPSRAETCETAMASYMTEDATSIAAWDVR